MKIEQLQSERNRIVYHSVASAAAVKCSSLTMFASAPRNTSGVKGSSSLLQVAQQSLLRILVTLCVVSNKPAIKKKTFFSLGKQTTRDWNLLFSVVVFLLQSAGKNQIENSFPD